MRYPNYILLLLVGVLVLGAGFTMPAIGGTQNQQTPAPEHGMAGMPMMENCPMQVSGADVSIIDTNDGIALSITTKSGDVADLRRRIENMAKMHSNDGMHGNMMPFSVTYEEIPNGGRLTLTPKGSANLEEFRTVVRQRAEQMKKHDCSMMQGAERKRDSAQPQGMMNSQEQPKAETKPKTDESDHSAHHPGGEK